MQASHTARPAIISIGRHGGIACPLSFNFRLADAPRIFGDLVHDHGNVQSTAEPGGLFWPGEVC